MNICWRDGGERHIQYNQNVHDFWLSLHPINKYTFKFKFWPIFFLAVWAQEYQECMCTPWPPGPSCLCRGRRSRRWCWWGWLPPSRSPGWGSTPPAPTPAALKNNNYVIYDNAAVVADYVVYWLTSVAWWNWRCRLLCRWLMQSILLMIYINDFVNIEDVFYVIDMIGVIKYFDMKM